MDLLLNVYQPMRDLNRARARVFKALADPIRLSILEYLRSGEKCVCDIVTYVRVIQPVVSRHLAILKNCGFVKCRKHKNRRFYSVSDPEVFRVIDVVDASLLNTLSRKVIEEIA